MKKYLLRIWTGHHSFEEAKKKSKNYVTIKITETTEEQQETNFNVFNDGICYIECNEYEIIGSESGEKWFELVNFVFDGTTLTIKPVEESYTMSFPIEIRK
jgi:hypothetical protein